MSEEVEKELSKREKGKNYGTIRKKIETKIYVNIQFFRGEDVRQLYHI